MKLRRAAGNAAFALALAALREPGEKDGLVEDGGGPGARLPHQVGGHGRFRFAQAGRVAQNLHGAVRLPDIGRRVAEGPGIERVAPAAHQGHGPERPGDEILMPLFRRNGPIGGAGLLHDVPQEGHAVLRLRREVREPLIREPGEPGGIALVVHDGRVPGKIEVSMTQAQSPETPQMSSLGLSG